MLLKSFRPEHEIDETSPQKFGNMFVPVVITTGAIKHNTRTQIKYDLDAAHGGSALLSYAPPWNFL